MVISFGNVEELIALINNVYGFDLGGYSRASLKRRISRILAIYRIDFTALKDNLVNSPGFFNKFLVEVTVTVTEMFRDPIHFCIPSIDVTMQSTADVYGPSTAAILLSGANQDGAAGMVSIHRAGGLCIVQHPHDAEIETMPATAIAQGAPHHAHTTSELIRFSQQLNHHVFRS